MLCRDPRYRPLWFRAWRPTLPQVRVSRQRTQTRASLSPLARFGRHTRGSTQLERRRAFSQALPLRQGSATATAFSELWDSTLSPGFDTKSHNRLDVLWEIEIAEFLDIFHHAVEERSDFCKL